ncbi:hypothetical protein LTR39_004823, partial [Cryomyces antarcticus]
MEKAAAGQILSFESSPIQEALYGSNLDMLDLQVCLHLLRPSSRISLHVRRSLVVHLRKHRVESRARFAQILESSVRYADLLVRLSAVRVEQVVGEIGDRGNGA